jgi:protein ImuA
VSSKPRHVNREAAPAEQRAVLERLRARLAGLEALGQGGGPVVPLGLPGIDGALPGGGLPRGRLLELCGASCHAAAVGFAAVLLGRLMATGGHVVWIGPRDELFGPGLAEFGLAPERLIVVRARPRAARLWALEEALLAPGLAAALAEVDQLSLTQSRRLQLAAEANGVTALLLRPPGAGTTPCAATTRWRIEAAPSGAALSEEVLGEANRPRRASGRPHWRIDLFRCRGGRTGSWRIARHEDGWREDGWHEDGWHEVPDSLALAAESGDRPAAAPGPARRRRA